MKLCAVVITYFPNVDETRENILRYIDDVEHVIVWENTPLAEREKHRIQLPEHQSKVSYMGADENRGIAYPLNKAIEWAGENGYTHVMTMDQDSSWHNFKIFRQEIENCSDDRVAMFTPTIYNNIDNRQLELVPPITSGAVHPISVFSSIGYFCEEYFIDAIDHEFYYRIILNSFTVRHIPSARLNHSLGYKQRRRFLMFSMVSSNYSAFRLYHMVRNNIWMYKKYRHETVLPKGFVKQLISEVIFKPAVKIVLVEDGKWAKLKAIYKGIRDGIKRA